ncbi:hypothetical protein BOTNAR_0131g00100 [Botryotinia narcissicola]|uniref:Cytochrome P450 n=1 Tax=Botryotinia narcissicola TaxID=278944 RepID=A0A4Z1IL57_9HELO|nr:hypothetical protein BOTNAR_0131g00100 [Botryotinia narcissicola]
MFFSQVATIVVVAVTLVTLFKRWKQNSEGFESLSTISRILHPYGVLKRRLKAWLYLFSGPLIIQTAYNKANGEPFEILAPDNRYVFVSSQKHIGELNNAPDTVLSLQAASKQMLQPKYTMSGFNWFDRRGTEGVGFIKALRTLLTNNLPSILPSLRIVIANNFSEMHYAHKVVNAFFGEELAGNKEFMKSALSFIEDTLMTAETVRLLPEWLAQPIGQLLAGMLSSHRTVFDTLLPVAEQRLLEKQLEKMGQTVPKHHDCIQWIMETAPKKNPWTGQRIVHELMAIWFGSVHALSTTISFAIHDLCLHPEYVDPLREEIEGPGYALFEQTAQGLPLLDSFIKESARLTPVESMSTRRHALQPFTLSDGTRVEIGDWACTPVQAMMQDPKEYPEPLQFRGFRFVDPVLLPGAELPQINRYARPTHASKLTDVNGSFHVWGTGRMAWAILCSGRYEDHVSTSNYKLRLRARGQRSFAMVHLAVKYATKK